MGKRCYGKPPAGVDPPSLKGKLIVVEGADGSGRSTQIALLQDLLEKRGYPTIPTGLKRSKLVAKELTEAMGTTMLHVRTLSLLYATDFADQMEHVIVPALRAGFVVLADRYIYTLMARSIIRGLDASWVRGIYEFAIIPDLIIHLKVTPRTLAERTFLKGRFIDYWESGQDIQRSADLYQGFIRYQSRMQRAVGTLGQEYPFIPVNGEASPEVVHLALQEHVISILR
jgi:dTMP kinase